MATFFFIFVFCFVFHTQSAQLPHENLAVYCVQKAILGKGVNELRERVNGHRSSFYDVIKKDKSVFDNIEEYDDEKILRLHLYLHHNKCDRKDFNNCYRFNILKTCPPDRLRINEQFYIETLNTLMPYGLNVIKSVTS